MSHGNGASRGGMSRLWSGLLTALWRPSGAREEDLAAYRRLAQHLHYQVPRDEGLARSVLLVSAESSPLAAQGSITLARCFADEVGRTAMLVDACPPAPAVSRLLGSDGAPGFADFLRDPGLGLDRLVLPTSHPLVSFLPAGAGSDASRLGPPENLRRLLERAAPDYDLILLCGGSILEDSVGLGLAPWTGTVLLLAVENETPLEKLEAARSALEFCGPRQLGVVLTEPVRPEGP